MSVLSPIWDYEMSPMIEVSESQLNRLSQDETYFDSFIGWMNTKLREGTATGKTVQWDATIPNLQPKPDNIVSRLVGESFYDQVTRLFSTQEANFVVQVSDEETTKKVEWLRQNIIPILSHLLNGNLERYYTVKRLEEAKKEVDKNPQVSSDEENMVKDLLGLIEKCDVQRKDVTEAEWQKAFGAIRIYKKKTPKVANLVHAFDVRLARGIKLRRVISAVENAVSKDVNISRKGDVLKMIQVIRRDFESGNLESIKHLDSKGSAIFTCDVIHRFSLSCADDGYYDIPKILQEINELLENNTEEELKYDLLFLLLDKLKKYADDKTIVYENLLDLFESSNDREFAKILKQDYVPKIQDLFTYSSFLVNNWQSFIEMIHIIRSKLESIEPSDSHFHFDKTADTTKSLQTLQDLQRLQRREIENNELEKRCSYNRLTSVFSIVDETIGATSLGGSFPERLRSIYFRLWGSLQHIVENDETDDRIFHQKTFEALGVLVRVIGSVTEKMQLSRNHDNADRLQTLNRTWGRISSAIDVYLELLKDDRQTLPVLLDNHVFQIDRANSLLPKLSNDIQDTISKLTFKIFYMQIFFESLCNSITALKNDLKKDLKKDLTLRTRSIGKRDRTTAKRNTQRLIDEIQYRERHISGEFKTDASYAAAFRIICDTIVRHTTWYLCVGSISDDGSNTQKRYNIDFRINDRRKAADEIHFERLPDIGNYVLYMKQFIDDNNRTRKTSAFKIDFFQMVYTQYLSSFHSIETGSGADVAFLTDQFVIAQEIEKVAKALKTESATPIIFEQVRSSLPYKQLVDQYSYDELVRSWSIEALSESDFLLLMNNARDFYNIVQIFYDSIFRKRGEKFENTTKSSLYDSLNISNLMSVVRLVTPDWYTDDMCEMMVKKMLFDTTARRTEKRDLIGDAKKFVKKIRRAGGTRNQELIAAKYIHEALKLIAKWTDEGGVIEEEYLRQFQQLHARVRQNARGLLDAVFGNDLEGLLAENRDYIIGKVGRSPEPKEYISKVSDILEKDYEIAPDLIRRKVESKLVQRETESSEPKLDDNAVKNIKIFKALQ